MRIDCTTCPVRGRRCEGCVLTAVWQLPQLLGTDPAEPGRSPGASEPAGKSPAAPGGPPTPGVGGSALDAAERRAVAVFVAAGLLTRQSAGQLRAHVERPGRPDRRVVTSAPPPAAPCDAQQTA